MSKKGAVYILAARRTPFGKFWGALKDISAPKLGSEVIRKILEETGVDPNLIDGVFMGEVLTAGVGQNPARQAALYAGLPNTCDARIFNKVCSSSLVAMEHAVERIQLGKARLMIAGGMENMSRAPYLLRRWAKNLGDRKLIDFLSECEVSQDATLIDSMIFDGLCDIYDADLSHMGKLADMCARVHGISREEQMEYAFASFTRALEAQRAGLLDSQLVTVTAKDGAMLLAKDEGVYAPDLERWKKSKPAFSEDGTVIAGTSSQVSDGAAALLLASAKVTKKLGIRPLACVVAFAVHSQEPEWYTTAPVGAIRKVLEKARLFLGDIDLIEINEAFAVVPKYAIDELGIDEDKVNICGGAIAMGHPIGASGARITGNLVHQLIHTNGRYGIAVACNGGGEAVAVLIENMHRVR